MELHDASKIIKKICQYGIVSDGLLLVSHTCRIGSLQRQRRVRIPNEQSLVQNIRRTAMFQHFIGIGKERHIFDILAGLIRLRSIIRDPGFEWARCDKPILCQVVEETDLLTEMLTFPQG